jgi:4-hydroxybenzoate polyprenyltransferase
VTALASLGGLIRLVHPFPSLLCASATAVIATLAGGSMETAARLGVAMLGIQVSIGALNDIVDSPLDATQKPRKPIPSGLVTKAAAGVVAAIGAAVGIVLSAVSGPATTVAALACLGLGYGYDLRLSRTALSWLPLSIALPLLPIHAWLGAAGVIPTGLMTLVPVGVLGGAGLALANGLVDIERDATAGRRAIAVALGPRWGWVAQTLALAGAAALAVVLAPAVPAAVANAGGTDIAVLRTVRTVGIWLGIALLAAGATVLASRRASVRERGWELEAVGVAAIGLGWLAGTAGAVAGG